MLTYILCPYFSKRYKMWRHIFFDAYDICIDWKKFPMIYYRWERQKTNHFLQASTFFTKNVYSLLYHINIEFSLSKLSYIVYLPLLPHAFYIFNYSFKKLIKIIIINYIIMIINKNFTCFLGKTY